MNELQKKKKLLRKNFRMNRWKEREKEKRKKEKKSNRKHWIAFFLQIGIRCYEKCDDTEFVKEKSEMKHR